MAATTSSHPSVRDRDAELSALISDFTYALQTDDLDGILDVLHPDAMWSMPPLPSSLHGHEAIARYLETGPFTRSWRHVRTETNGNPAVACYRYDEQADIYLAYSVDVLKIDDGKIRAVTAVRGTKMFRQLGLATTCD